MIDRILAFSAYQRLLIVIAAVFLIGFGAVALRSLPIDAVPDVTNNQVQINTRAAGLAPSEVEQRITTPVEIAVAGLPDVVETRSISQPGLSQVTVVFDDSVSIYFARQLLLERLASIGSSLPAGVETPAMSPISTGLGEIYQYDLESETVSPTELRTLQEFLVKPQLRSVPGVAEVNTYGGFEKQYQIEIDTQKMLARDVTLRQITEAVERGNSNAGGGIIIQGARQLIVRGVGAVRGVDDLAMIVVDQSHQAPVYLRDVAAIREGTAPRTSGAAHNGHETVLGVVMMLKGANSRTVARAVDAKIDSIRSELPKGVRIATVYDRTELVDKTIHTVQSNLIEGGVLVIGVLLLLLGNVRGALIVACLIPMSMLFAVIGMREFGISANLLSLGAIDFGLIVDGGVVLVENTIRRLAQERERVGRTLTRAEVVKNVLASAREVGAPLTFGIGIIILVYLPIMTLTGVEGKTFRPMAYTVSLALAGALLLTLTLIPALCALGLSRDTKEKENKLMHWFERRYAPVLRWALARKGVVATAGGAFFLGCASLFPLLGSEFTPTLDEGAIAISAVRMPGVTVDQSVLMVRGMQRTLVSFPEVSGVFDRSGTPEIASDPMPPSLSDTVVTLKERSEWRPGMTREKLVAEMSDRLDKESPGMGYSFSQPIKFRTDELVSGVKADVALKIYGDNLDELHKIGNRLTNMLQTIPGAEDVALQQGEGLPTLEITVDRERAARYGVSVGDVQDVIETAIGGRELGQVAEGDRRFDIIAKLPEAQRGDLAAIRALPVSAPGGQRIPLSELAEIAVREAPAQISREQGQRLAIVQANVRGRDLGSFITEAQSRAARDVPLPAGYRIEWGGQFETLQSARARLAVVVPLTLGAIFLLLYLSFQSVRQAAIVFSGVPLAVTGGILALLGRGLPFSISAGIGFIALFGVAVLNGLVLVSAINKLRTDGRDLPEAVQEGAQTRLRPVLMTALVASLGFVPMAISTGMGAEVQRPLATVVIGGIVSSTLLTLVVLPALYALLEKEGAVKETEMEEVR
ncbi:MAG: cation transporter [Capsulimonas sp.]|nr:cation transporter [Capsulimonas sp.]